MRPLPNDDFAPAPRCVETGLNILVVGVGGQGVLMISKALALLAQRRGFEVKQSEVHGMAKRGGIVFSHVRFAPKVWSPTIAKGEADVLIALEWAEGLRWLDHLRPGRGVFIADTRRIVPPFACRSRKPGAPSAYARETPAEIVGRHADGCALDATEIATALGDARTANTVLLGRLSAWLDYPVGDWHAVVEAIAPKGTAEINRRAFDAGRAWTPPRTDIGDPGTADATVASLPPAALPDLHISVAIDPAWCKGCAICVKLCPERCLAMDGPIAVVATPSACTGCRVCEWLCPDFAVTVRNEGVPA
ncbi:2-oxoacid:acceptor oxidoreductase family protein [Rhodoplanes serenus]|uniref:2-oxoacid:acceptor oxidoreductase family protein n=1 Tax=Rhodoplanes serenus TaxID=200615 RepID=UPI000DAC46B0|nr:2-oxoacid:acceptor oxidoreductase family protein [Rhodoplanes serenus]RAI35309.1 pyruvate ferredoxin oxidoreductase [Rhodoplanes serenus]